MEIVIRIIGGFVVLVVAYGIFYFLCRSFPWLRWVLALGLGLGSFFLWGIWWVSLLIAFFSLGLFFSLTATKTRRGNAIVCDNCRHDILDILSQDDDHISYKCCKCGHRGSYSLHR